MNEKPKAYTVNDRRGQDKASTSEVCQVCGSPTVHTQDYNKPTMDCIKYLRNRISALEAEPNESV